MLVKKVIIIFVCMLNVYFSALCSVDISLYEQQMKERSACSLIKALDQMCDGLQDFYTITVTHQDRTLLFDQVAPEYFLEGEHYRSCPPYDHLLQECTCGEFSRAHTDARVLAEHLVAFHVPRLFGDKRNKLTIIDLGAGRLYSIARIALHLQQLGYTTLHLVLIDTDYRLLVDKYRLDCWAQSHTFTPIDRWYCRWNIEESNFLYRVISQIKNQTPLFPDVVFYMREMLNVELYHGLLKELRGLVNRPGFQVTMSVYADPQQYLESCEHNNDCPAQVLLSIDYPNESYSLYTAFNYARHNTLKQKSFALNLFKDTQIIQLQIGDKQHADHFFYDAIVASYRELLGHPAWWVSQALNFVKPKA